MKFTKFFEVSNYFSITVFISLSLNTYGQDQIREELYVFSSEIPLLNYNTFQVSRIYWSENYYTDFGILCQDTSKLCSLSFTNHNSVWKLKEGNDSYDLFDKDYKLNRIKLRNKTILPKRIFLTQTDTIYSFTCRDESYQDTTDYNEYLFSKKKGIIGLLTTSTMYKRIDFAEITKQSELISVDW